MNDLLEIFMQMYVDDKFELVLKLNDEKITQAGTLVGNSLRYWTKAQNCTLDKFIISL